MTDHPETTDVGPYVLDALGPAERAAFGEHLRVCARCQDEVAELGGLPALLDRVPPDVVAALAEHPDRHAVTDEGAEVTDPAAGGGPPASVLRTLVEAARAEEARVRRRRWWGAGLAAAAVAGALAVGQAVLPWSGPDEPPVAAVELAPVEGVVVPVTVDVELRATDWGTRLTVTCAYRDGEQPPSATSYGPDPGYALVLTGADGESEQVATWGVVPGHDVVVPAATRLGPGEIERIDLRTVGGTTVLSAEP